MDAEAVEEFALEAALFDEPAGVDFVAVLAAVDWVALFFGFFGGFVGEVDIFKERAGAGGCERIGEFDGADSGDDFADAGRAKVGDAVVRNVALYRVVEGAAHLAVV